MTPEDSNTEKDLRSPQISEIAAFLPVLCSPVVAFVQLAQPQAFWIGGLAFASACTAFLASRRSKLAPHALFWLVLLAGIVLGVPWPLSFVLPLILLFVAAAFWPWMASTLSWWRWGIWDKYVGGLVVLVTVASSAGLVLWFVNTSVDLGEMLAQLPDMHLMVFVAAAMVFSVLNACWEEFLFKGMMWDGLSATGLRENWVNWIQAFFFGLVHYHGFPNGWTGVAMAGVYGLAIGWIRKRSKGMFAPVLTHIFADLTICTLVYLRWRGYL